MKRLLATLAFVLVLGASVLPSAAACSTHTYFVDGRIVICSTCCTGSSCTTTCF